MNLPDLVGMIGVIFYIVAYAGVQFGRFQQNDLRYIGLNILGPVCMLFSLAFNFNLAAVVTQLVWLLLTALGLAKVIRARGKAMPRAARDCLKS